MDPARLHIKMQEEVRLLREYERELGTLLSNRQVMDGQLKESEIVLKELELVDANSKVLKLVGSVLLEQEKNEATANVSKRIEFINSELKKLEGKIKETQAKIKVKQRDVVEVQNSFRASAAGHPS